MDGLEPVINLLVFLTALSVAAERFTNSLKLRNVSTAVEKDTKEAEKERERAINFRSLLVGIGIAILLKADMIAALHRLEAPWQTLGWARLEGEIVIWSPELRSFGAAAFTVLGCIATGLALGFGSKFWHEILDTVLQLREMTKLKNEERRGMLPDGGNGGSGIVAKKKTTRKIEERTDTVIRDDQP